MKSAAQSVVPVVGVLMSGIALAGCGIDAERTAGPVVRDSAGIRIVEHAGDAPELWTVAAEPSVTIGVEDGDAMQLLFRVAGALAVGNDEIVIANAASPVLRWFDGQGRFLRGTGRAGGGPGEFQGSEGAMARVAALWPLAGDSVATWEHAPMRMQVFDSSARYARAVTLQIPTGMVPGSHPQIVGRMGDAGFVAFLATFSEPRVTSEAWRDSMTYAWWLGDGTFGDTIARLPGMELHSSEFMGRRSAGRVPFGRPFAGAADASGFYYGSADTYEIHAFDDSGRLRMILRRDAAARPIGEADVEAYIEAEMRNAPEEPQVRQAWEATLRAAPFPATLPAYRRIRTDRVGNLWVQDYDLPDEREVLWNVFDAQGAWLAAVRTPRDWQIHDIGSDYVLAVTRSEIDVERVQLFALDRSGSAAVEAGRSSDR